MIRRLTGLTWCTGHSGTRVVIAAQLGLAMMPLWSAIRRALISGTTSGMAGSARKALELSTTTAPAFTAMGAYCLEMPEPAENSAMSTPSKLLSFSSSITSSWPRKVCFWPAERALASSLSDASGMPRLSMQPMNSRPTAPVAPTMATVLFFTSSLHFKTKKPRSFRSGAGCLACLST